MKTKPNYIGSGFLVLVLVVVSGVASLTQATPNVTQNQAPTTQTYDQLEVFHQNFVMFVTDIFLKRDKTRVRFPFAFTDKPLTIWFGFDPVDDDRRDEILVSHPQLLDLNWPVVSQGNLQLFQRQKSFESVGEFLNSEIDPDKVLIDSLLQDNYPQFSDSQITDFEFDLEKYDYILTTYRHSEYKNGVYYFERIIDASTAELMDEKAIQWYLRAPDATEENTYKRGIIDINYLQ